MASGQSADRTTRPYSLAGAMLREFRERAALSQEALAAQAGLSDKTIRNFESGLRRPRRSTVDQLIAVLGLAAEDRAGFVAAWHEQYRPCSLPSDIPDFVGRAEPLDLVATALVSGHDGVASAVTPVCVVAGMGGIGKTALAVRASHRVADSFPDGQIWLNLRGTGPDPVDPLELLARVLDRMGVPAPSLPRDLDARAELLRDRLSGRRVLIVADDAASEAQIRPLIPGDARSAVLVTSRGRLAGLAGAVLVGLDVLAPDEACGLLAAVIGAARVEVEPDEAAELVLRCGLLPLAVRIVAAMLAGRPRWRIRHVADLLSDERDRLDVLAVGDLQVSASIRLSCEALSAPARRALRQLSRLDAPDFAGWLGAAALDLPVSDARRLLEQLVDAHLLESADTDPVGQVRYRFHDLVRVYARHHDVGGEPGDDVNHGAVIERAGLAALALAERAARDVPRAAWGNQRRTPDHRPEPGIPSAAKAHPLRWLDSELAAVVATARQAAAQDHVLLATDLLGAMSGYLSVRCEFLGWRALAEAVGEAAVRTGDAEARVSAQLALADLQIEQGDLDHGRETAAQARQAAERNGLPRLALYCLLTMAVADRGMGNADAAGSQYALAATEAQAVGDDVAYAYALCESGALHAEAGEYDAAERCYLTARPMLRAGGDVRGENRVMLRLASLAQRRGDRVLAERGYREALALADKLGDVRATAEIRYRLGQLHLAAGEVESAADLLLQVVGSCREVGDTRGEALGSDMLGQVLARLGKPAGARASYEVALAYYRRHGLDAQRDQVLAQVAELGDSAR
jgi:transcriptional regulator with XRE-family HTH domain/tetratricopeptide (TPR) repeat protein